MAGEFASLYNVTCVLKDFRTIIAAADGERFINLSGNCGMATAGSGDVLSGIVGGLLVQWRDTKKAAAYGTFIHGLAGDMVFDNTGSYGMIAMLFFISLDISPRCGVTITGILCSISKVMLSDMILSASASIKRYLCCF